LSYAVKRGAASRRNCNLDPPGSIWICIATIWPPPCPHSSCFLRRAVGSFIAMSIKRRR